MKKITIYPIQMQALRHGLFGITLPKTVDYKKYNVLVANDVGGGTQPAKFVDIPDSIA